MAFPITCASTPQIGAHLVNKTYVDDIVSSFYVGGDRCWEIVPTNPGSTKPLSSEETINASGELTLGTWAITGYLWLSKGNGTFLVNSSITVLWNNVDGIRKYPSSAGFQYNIPHTNTSSTPINLCIGTVNVVVTTAGATQTIGRSVLMTIGTTTSWSMSFSGVRIA